MTDRNRRKKLAHLLNVHNETRQLLEQHFLKDAALLEKEYDPKGKIVVLPLLFGMRVFWEQLLENGGYLRKPDTVGCRGRAGQRFRQEYSGFNLYRALKAAGKYDKPVDMKSCRPYSETSQPGKFKERSTSCPDWCKRISAHFNGGCGGTTGTTDENLMRELEALQPFGYSNPEPVLLCRQTGLLDCRVVGREGKHLKLKVLAETSQLEAIAFNFGHLTETAAALEQNTDLVFSIERNVWNGQEKMQLKIKDFRFPEEETPNSVKSGGYFSFSTVKAGRQDYFCLNGFQQFDLLLEIIRFNRQRGHNSLVVFPTKRIMALYYRFLWTVYRNMVSVVPGWTGKERLFPGEKIPIATSMFFLPLRKSFFLLILTKLLMQIRIAG